MDDVAPDIDEQVDESAEAEIGGVNPAEGVGERTGVPAVDRVLAGIESVGELPLSERVAVFEQAHDSLRRALDAHPTADVAGR